MKRQEIINKVKQIFGVQKFGMYKSAEGVEFRIEALAVGTEIYVITPEGELPAMDGEVVLEDGTKLMVKDGMIDEMMLPEITEEQMADAELADGTKITTKEEGDFMEGQMLYVIDAEGNEVMAPEGSHTTKSGIEIVVDAEGKITGVKYPDVAGEGSLSDMSNDKKKMAQITLIDGTIVETEGELVAGADLFVITEEGRQPASSGEYETEDNKIVVVEDGKIVEVKEKEETEIEVEIEMMETFTKAFQILSDDIKALRVENEELKNKFSKFAGEPAAEKIYDKKGAYVASLEKERFSKLEQLAVLRKSLK
jgi:hypothetical protein